MLLSVSSAHASQGTLEQCESAARKEVTEFAQHMAGGGDAVTLDLEGSSQEEASGRDPGYFRYSYAVIQDGKAVGYSRIELSLGGFLQAPCRDISGPQYAGDSLNW